MARSRPPTRRRAAAWLVTGPLGHLCGGLADWLELLGGHLRARARERARGAVRRRLSR